MAHASRNASSAPAKSRSPSVDSVHKLLGDQVQALGLGGFYDVQQAVIKGANGTEFLFSSLSDQTAESIKSFEGVDKVWVEEAQAVSKRSWDILVPTIRRTVRRSS